MRHFKILVVLLALTVPFAGNLFATCHTEGSVGGGTPYLELLYDVNFAENCTYWIWTSPAARVDAGGGVFYANFPITGTGSGGSLRQDITVPSNSTSQQMTINVDIVDNGAGNEKLWIRILNTSGTVLETLGSIPALNNSGGRYDFDLASNYAGQTIRVQLSAPAGMGHGQSEFHVTGVHFYEYY